MNNMKMFYIGYYKDNILLCVSDNKKHVQRYLNKVRKLIPNNSSITHTYLKEQDIEELYGDYILEEYGIFYLTRRDISEIHDHTEELVDKIDSIASSLDAYIDLINGISTIEQDVDQFLSSKRILSAHCIDNNIFRRIVNRDILMNCIVFNVNITDYLNGMGYHEEKKSLMERYRFQVSEEDIK